MLKRHDLNTMDVQLRSHLNDLSAYVTKNLHTTSPKRTLWEVYCGSARTSKIAESLETGWNFDRLDHQEAFLQLQDDEAPDEVLLAPECRLWSRMQSLARRTPAQQEALIAARQRHHDRHLLFSRRVYLKQVEGG